MPLNRWLASFTSLKNRAWLDGVQRPGRRLLDHQVEAVDLLPHLRRDDLPDRPRILPRRPQARDNRVGVFTVKRQELE